MKLLIIKTNEVKDVADDYGKRLYEQGLAKFPPKEKKEPEKKPEAKAEEKKATKKG